MNAEPSAVELLVVPWNDPRASALRLVMDAEMNARYRTVAMPPEVSAAIDRALAVDPSHVHTTLLALDDDGTPIGHAALRTLGDELEVKRVIVTESSRGRGVGRSMMAELERIALASGVHRLILQTGDRQPEAIALYERIGYRSIPLYEPYASAMPGTLAYAKDLGAHADA